MTGPRVPNTPVPPSQTPGENGADANPPDGKSLGMGGEAVAASQQNDAATGRGTDGGADRAGSEPLDREREHVPSYGGMGGEPRVSSDQREPADPSGGQADDSDPPNPTPS